MAQPSQEERQRAELLLLLLLARRWARLFGLHEAELTEWFIGTMAQVKLLEARGADVMLAHAARTARVGSDGRVVLSGTAAEFRSVRKRFRRVYSSALSEKGSLGRRGSRRLETSFRAGVADADAEFSSTRDLAAMSGVTLMQDRLKEQRLSPEARWALLADIGQMARSAEHKAVLGASTLRGADVLAAGSTQSKLATRINRSSLRNTFMATSRRAYREGVYSRTGSAFSGWSAFSTAEGTGVLERLDEAAWARRARSLRRDGFLPGNPTRAFGMHVGSTTYFVPMLGKAELALLATALLALGHGTSGLLTGAESVEFGPGGLLESLASSVRQEAQAVVDAGLASIPSQPDPEPSSTSGLVVAVAASKPELVAVDFVVEPWTLVEIQRKDGKGTLAQIRIVAPTTPWSSVGWVVFRAPGAREIRFHDLATTQLTL